MASKPNIMVSSSVYGFEDTLSQICALLKEMGYNVWNSYKGTIKVNSKLSNMENCLKAVEECDLFLGIIRTQCGTGYIGDKNITFEEMKKAIECKKPYWFLVHRDVTFARQLFRKIDNPENVKFKDKKFFDPLCIEMFDFVTKSEEPVEARIGNWVQEFFKFEDIVNYLTTQFADKEYIIDQYMRKEQSNG